MADSDQVPEPVQCRAGCGFWGNAANDNLCSKCARELASDSGTVQAPSDGAAVMAAAMSSPSPAAPSILTPAPPVSASSPTKQPVEDISAATSPSPAEASAPGGDEPPRGDGPPKKKKARCFSCRKKTGMLGFVCRCGENFCAAHRHSDQHDCSFDYATHGKAIIAKNNEAVIADKLDRL